LATLTQQEINRLWERAELNTCTDQWSAVSQEAAPQVGLRLEKVGSATALMMSNVDIGDFNRVFGVGIDEPATESALDEIMALYAPAGNAFIVSVDPAARPAELVTWLEARGLTHVGNIARFYRDAALPPDIATDLRIESIGPERAGDWAEVGLAAFGMPPMLKPWAASLIGRPNWLNYLAFDGDRPVAIASLRVQDGIGWLGNGATLPSHRRRGAQGALMARRIRDGVEQMHCEWFVTETDEDTPDNPNPSYHNMVRTGFELAYLRANYGRTGTAHS
jgi:hypothetical protein